MPNTQRFGALSARLDELRKIFLPRIASTNGAYKNSQKDKFRGYRLLVHAEIESFLEEIAKDKIIQSVKEFKVLNKESKCLLSFCISYNFYCACDDFGYEGFSSKKIITPEHSLKFLDNAVTQYMKMIIDNHGIREDSLKKIFIPIGIDFSSLDPTWVINMDAYGKLRGEAAHKSKQVQQPINPFDESKKVSEILIGLKELDSKVMEM